MTDWNIETLGSACDIIMGQSPPGSTYNKDGKGLPFFQGKAEFGTMYPTASTWCSEPKKIAEPNDILISVRAPVGPTNMSNQKSCIGRGLTAIRPKNGLEPKYVLYYLRSIENDIAARGSGSTFQSISKSQIENLQIVLAPPDQQRRIVAEIEKQFSRLDEAVAGLKRVKANLRRYKAAVLKAAVEGKLTEEWRKAHPDVEPASELLKWILAARRKKWEEAELAKMKTKGKKPKDDSWKKKYKEPTAPSAENLPVLPPTWTWSTVQQLAEIQLGKMLDAQKQMIS